MNSCQEKEVSLQQYIRQTYGQQRIDEARERLCHSCSLAKCGLLPIISDGSDCPYFILRSAMPVKPTPYQKKKK